MKLFIAALLAVSCPETKMTNRTDYPWNDHDRETMSYCQKRCSQIYKDSPCLKEFIKWDKQDYHCICGK